MEQERCSVWAGAGVSDHYGLNWTRTTRKSGDRRPSACCHGVRPVRLHCFVHRAGVSPDLWQRRLLLTRCWTSAFASRRHGYAYRCLRAPASLAGDQRHRRFARRSGAARLEIAVCDSRSTGRRALPQPVRTETWCARLTALIRPPGFESAQLSERSPGHAVPSSASARQSHPARCSPCLAPFLQSWRVRLENGRHGGERRAAAA